MLYATCSIFGEENEDQVAAFIESHADAQREAIVLSGVHAQGAQLLPVGPHAEHNHDGFFYALLQKR